LGIVAAERATCAIAKRVVIRRRCDVVAVLNKLGYGRSVDGLVDVLVVPSPNIGEMDPILVGNPRRLDGGQLLLVVIQGPQRKLPDLLRAAALLRRAGAKLRDQLAGDLG
jgi:hypothetical protein